ncbi:MAG: hypothetical protein ACW986_14345 [Promethearchaeota archaeon]|jgi:hypothetical protein
MEIVIIGIVIVIVVVVIGYLVKMGRDVSRSSKRSSKNKGYLNFDVLIRKAKKNLENKKKEAEE